VAEGSEWEANEEFFFLVRWSNISSLGQWRRSGEEGRGNQGNHPAIMDVPRGLPHGT